MSLTLPDIRMAAERIAPYAVRTPLLRLKNLDKALGCEVYVKPECLQVTGSFKFRGAMNKLLTLTEEERARGVVAASSGNHGKALAYAAGMLGVKAVIILPDTATQIKVDTIRHYGAEIVFSTIEERFETAERVCRERGTVMVPPFNDEQIMAGQGTAGLEILEECPEMDAVVVPVSGGGLIGGLSTAVKAFSPRTKVFGAEPAVVPRYSESLKAGKRVKVQAHRSVADGLISLIPGDVCFPYVAAGTDGFAAVEEEFILKGWKLLVTEGKIFGEPSGAITMGAVLQGLLPVKKTDKVCFFISGGSVSLEQLHILESVEL